MSQSEIKRLDELFAAEPDRLSRLSFEAAGLYFDWSKTHLDAGLIKEFSDRAETAGFAGARETLFSGGIANPSEGRAATHVAERGSGAPDDVELATARRLRMRALVDAVEAGVFGDITGVLHIGIGGSVLGPALLVDALGRRNSTLNVRFLSNIDGAAFDDAVRTLDPATTLVVVASKTFTTAGNAGEHGGGTRLAPGGRPERSRWPVHRGYCKPRGRARGGDRRDAHSRLRGQRRRALLAVEHGRRFGGAGAGWDAFEGLLEGAAEMDRHFRFAEPAANVPLVAAFADRLYTEKLGARLGEFSLTMNGSGCCLPTSSSWRWSRTASRFALMARRSTVRPRR